MSLRRRLIASFLAVVLVTLGGSFITVSLVVNRAEERQLDEVLRAEATAEARKGSVGLLVAGEPTDAVDIDVGGLTKYAVVYGADGRVLRHSRSFACGPPARRDLPAEGVNFNLWCGGAHLRGAVTLVPGQPGQLLLLAAPRAELEGEAALLRRAMAGVLGLALLVAVGLATWLSRELIRDHRALALVVRKVAEGDLGARVRTEPKDPELRQLRDDINNMSARLELLVESQRRFIAHAAHELRSPLTTLYGELSHALRRERDAPAYRAAISEALDATQRLRRMTEDLLALARLGEAERGEVVPVKLTEVVRESVVLCEGPAAERAVQVVITCAEAWVQGQALDLTRMVRNLVENAIAHSPAGGRVQVTGRTREGWLELVVEDEGSGVPEEARLRIFEPFFRGSRERATSAEGVGLGLAIARDVARAHGGEVTLAEARPSGAQGACFITRLPISAKDG